MEKLEIEIEKPSSFMSQSRVAFQFLRRGRFGKAARTILFDYRIMERVLYFRVLFVAIYWHKGW